ncbi:hypothetical protein H1P_2310005 [Hyella patelloides LEGE 07179]|uniref:Uncharacterized protein n=1 Tax=Hyella patelloides LEGE 07179 TaxID=945734 RepID=A0A563VRU7_9CYAN|nr:hypothetical protein [Hyella patelloides]VEP14007.1 hypothetical protein H1P_2310005 [Hyella patelloides LEGE 07179]
MLDAIAQLNNVAGGHARAYYEFAPRSVFARLTPKLVAGYKTYGFDDEGNFAELNRIAKRDSEDGSVIKECKKLNFSTKFILVNV